MRFYYAYFGCVFIETPLYINHRPIIKIDGMVVNLQIEHVDVTHRLQRVSDMAKMRKAGLYRARETGEVIALLESIKTGQDIHAFP
jgi:hypothetical protein